MADSSIQAQTSTSLALIQQDIVYMKQGIDEVKVTLKEINARFATKEEVEAQIKQIQKDAFTEIRNLKDKISYLEKGVWSAIAFVLYQLGVALWNLIVK
jgi:hypothetical protein